MKRFIRNFKTEVFVLMVLILACFAGNSQTINYTVSYVQDSLYRQTNINYVKDSFSFNTHLIYDFKGQRTVVSSSGNVTLDCKPVPSFVINNSNQCLRSNYFNFTNTSLVNGTGSINYLWNFGNSSVSNATSPSYSYSVPGIYSVKLVATKSNGCKDSISQLVTVYLIPIAGFTTNDTTQCVNGNYYAFTNISASGNDTMTYQWYFGDGSNSTIKNPTKTYSNSGIYSVKLIATNKNGCIDSAFQTITVYPKPNPAFTINKAVQCLAGNSYLYTNTSTISGGTLDYLWWLGDGTTSTAPSPSKSYSAIGTYTVKLIVTSNDGCKDSTTQLVTINPNPAPLISGLASVCVNSILNYSTPSDTGHTYKWIVNGGIISSGQGTANVGIVWGAAGTGTLIVIDSVKVTGCKTTTSSYSVTINPNPSPVISGNNSLCPSSFSTYSTPLNSGHSYKWAVTGGSIVSGQGTSGINIFWDSAGTKIVSVTDSINSTGCKFTASYSVTINPNPKPLITGPHSVCEGSISIYGTPYDTGRSYKWVINGGVIMSGQGTASIRVLWGANGTGTVSVTDSVNATGCKMKTIDYNVIINPNPTPLINGDTIICSGKTVSYSTPSNKGRNYNWVITGGTIISGQGTATITVTWGGAGIGMITVADSVKATGCKTTVSLYPIVINPNPTPQISGLITVCEFDYQNYSIQFNTGRSYLWYVIGGTIVSGQGTEKVGITWGKAGTGKVFVTDSAIYTGCSFTTQAYNVIINPKPSVILLGRNSICENGSTSYSISPKTGHTYIWSITGGVITSGQGTSVVNVTWNVSGKGTIEISDKLNSTGCTSITSMEVNVIPKPQPVISGNNTVCAGNTYFYSTPSDTGHTYTWAVSGGTIITGQATARISIKWSSGSSGTITVKDSANLSTCSASSSAFNVIIKPLPTPSIGGPQIVCPQGTASYSTTFNTGHTYRWIINGGTIISGQGSASITVRWDTTGTLLVTDSINLTGCTSSTLPYNVTFYPLPPSPLITGITKTCPHNILAYATLLNPAYSYQWVVTGGVIINGQNTASIIVHWGDSGIGLIKVITDITLTGCSNSSGNDTVKIFDIPAPRINPSGNLDVCFGDSIILSSNITSGIDSLLWRKNNAPMNKTNSIVVKASGIYTLRFYLNGCDSTSLPTSVSLIPNPQPIIKRLGDTLYSTVANNYQWYLNNIQINNAGSQFYIPKQNGIYRIKVTNSNGCSSMSDSFPFIGTGIKTNKVLDDIAIVPNPNDGSFEIISPTLIIQNYIIYDMVGKRIAQGNMEQKAKSVKVNIDIASGSYIVEIITEKGTIQRKFKIKK